MPLDKIDTDGIEIEEKSVSFSAESPTSKITGDTGETVTETIIGEERTLVEGVDYFDDDVEFQNPFDFRIYVNDRNFNPTTSFITEFLPWTNTSYLSDEKNRLFNPDRRFGDNSVKYWNPMDNQLYWYYNNVDDLRVPYISAEVVGQNYQIIATTRKFQPSTNINGVIDSALMAEQLDFDDQFIIPVEMVTSNNESEKYLSLDAEKFDYDQVVSSSNQFAVTGLKILAKVYDNTASKTINTLSIDYNSLDNNATTYTDSGVDPIVNYVYESGIGWSRTDTNAVVLTDSTPRPTVTDLLNVLYGTIKKSVPSSQIYSVLKSTLEDAKDDYDAGDRSTNYLSTGLDINVLRTMHNTLVGYNNANRSWDGAQFGTNKLNIIKSTAHGYSTGDVVLYESNTDLYQEVSQSNQDFVRSQVGIKGKSFINNSIDTESSLVSSSIGVSSINNTVRDFFAGFTYQNTHNNVLVRASRSNPEQTIEVSFYSVASPPADPTAFNSLNDALVLVFDSSLNQTIEVGDEIIDKAGVRFTISEFTFNPILDFDTSNLPAQSDNIGGITLDGQAGTLPARIDAYGVKFSEIGFRYATAIGATDGNTKFSVVKSEGESVTTNPIDDFFSNIFSTESLHDTLMVVNRIDDDHFYLNLDFTLSDQISESEKSKYTQAENTYPLFLKSPFILTETGTGNHFFTRVKNVSGTLIGETGLDFQTTNNRLGQTADYSQQSNRPNTVDVRQNTTRGGWVKDTPETNGKEVALFDKINLDVPQTIIGGTSISDLETAGYINVISPSSDISQIILEQNSSFDESQDDNPETTESYSE